MFSKGRDRGLEGRADELEAELKHLRFDLNGSLERSEGHLRARLDRLEASLRQVMEEGLSERIRLLEETLCEARDERQDDFDTAQTALALAIRHCEDRNDDVLDCAARFERWLRGGRQ